MTTERYVESSSFASAFSQGSQALIMASSGASKFVQRTDSKMVLQP
jgi:preprotein translocase subunit SecG